MAEERSKMADFAPQRVYRIGGISVEFPYKAYGSQLAYMGKVVATLERSHKQQQGHCHALLESPTGTGKSLALLCSTLAWQKHFKTSLATHPSATSIGSAIPLTGSVPEDLPKHSTPDAFAMGGGFIAEDSVTESEQAQKRSRNGSKQMEKKPKTPTIFYATRTHSQITQVLREYRKTSYRVPMAVLAARKHYCTNKHVRKKKNIDEECKLLLKDPNLSCPQFKNVHKLKNHTSLRKGGAHEIHDIEDLVGIGNSVKGCAYFAARSMALDAQIVFCPYGYILNPIIRRAMEINIQGAIVVLDEAHNIEDIAREAGSIDLETNILEAMRVELEQLSALGPTTDFYHPLLELVQEMLGWIYRQANNLEKQDFEHYSSCWSGEKALQELQSAGVSLQCFPILSECANKAIGAASDPESNTSHLSGFSASALEGLFSALNFMLCDNGKRLGDYRLVVQKHVKRDEELGVAGWSFSMSLWCLNPAVVFEEIASKAQSVILTSGTLSPIGSFASELGVPFEICMEAPHVIDMDKQVWAASVPMGPGKVPLNASYKHADGYAFQDSLGSALEELFKVSPDGALVFFPSYKLMEKLCNRWKATGQWNRLSEEKQLFTEPRGKQETFETMLGEYYKAVNGELKTVDRRSKPKATHRKKGVKDRSSQSCLSKMSKGGAAFLAVCRGKVSEGMDFSDKNARVVVVVGIPFPNQKDLQVKLKKQYNSENKASKSLLSGDQWYCYQAFRALNQAVGRCIRHRYDYGAIILIDERFRRSNNLEYMSKWLRKSIQQVDSFEQSVRGLQCFFQRFEVSSLGVSTSNANAGRNSISGHFEDSGPVSVMPTPSEQRVVEPSVILKSNTQTLKGLQKLSSAANCCISKSFSFKEHSTLTEVDDASNKAGLIDGHCHGAHTDDLIPGSQLNFNGCSSQCKKGLAAQQSTSKEILHHRTVESLDFEPAASVSPFSENASQKICTPLSLARNRCTDVAETKCSSMLRNSLSSCSETIEEVTPKNSALCLSTRNVDATDCPHCPGFSAKLPFSETEFGCNSEVCDVEGCPREQMQVAPYNLLGNKITEGVQAFSASVQNSISTRSLQELSTSDSIVRSLSPDFVACTETRLDKLVERQCHNLSSIGCYQSLNRNSTQDESSSKAEKGTVDTGLTEACVKENVILCCRCGNSLVVPEQPMHVTSYETSLKKSYLQGLVKSFNLCKGMQPVDPRHILVSEMCLLHPLLQKGKAVKYGSSKVNEVDHLTQPPHGVWVEEDGCVFRPLFCPLCEDKHFCIGAHVLAADRKNYYLVDKALLFVDAVKFSPGECREERQTQETHIQESWSISKSKAEAQTWNGQSLHPPPKRGLETPTRAKLKLPRRD